MIVFHEGLPGAGKSYESMVRRIIPALQKGRRVVAYVEALDPGRIAIAAELNEEQLRALLVSVTREQLECIGRSGERSAARHGALVSARRGAGGLARSVARAARAA